MNYIKVSTLTFAYMIIYHFHSARINSTYMYKCTFIVSTYFLIGWWWCSSFWIRDIPQLACCPCPTWQLAVVRLTATTHNSIFHPRPQSPAPLSSGSGSDKRSEEWSDVRWGERVTHPAPGSRCSFSLQVKYLFFCSGLQALQVHTIQFVYFDMITSWKTGFVKSQWNFFWFDLIISVLCMVKR